MAYVWLCRVYDVLRLDFSHLVLIRICVITITNYRGKDARERSSNVECCCGFLLCFTLSMLRVHSCVLW